VASLEQPVVISAFGMPSPVGLTAEQTLTSVRAQITAISEHPDIYFCGPDDSDFEDGTPLIASALLVGR
jgi:hypothetical protein